MSLQLLATVNNLKVQVLDLRKRLERVESALTAPTQAAPKQPEPEKKPLIDGSWLRKKATGHDR